MRLAEANPPRSEDRRHDLRAALGRFGLFYAILFVVLPVVVVVVLMDPLYWLWFAEFKAPAVQSALGFRMETRDVTLPSGWAGRRAVITDVTPGGAFDRAGAKAGDIVVCQHHGTEFWGAAVGALEGYETEFRVWSQSEFALGKDCHQARLVKLAGRSPFGGTSP